MVVRRLPTRPLSVAMLATIAAAVLGTQEVASASLLLLAYVVCLAACIVWWLLTGSALEREPLPDVMAALRPRAPAASPPLPRVVDLEWLVGAGMSSAIDEQVRRSAFEALAAVRRDLEQV